MKEKFLKLSELQKVGYLKTEDLNELRKAGAVGDIGFRFFIRAGKQSIIH